MDGRKCHMIDPMQADIDLDESLLGEKKRPNINPPPKEKSTDHIDRQEADRLKAIAQAKNWELRNKILDGEYVERSGVERQLAARASIIKSDMENFFRSRIGDLITMCEGDQKYSPDIINYMLSNLEAWLGRYAQPIEFDVKDEYSDEKNEN